MQVFHSGLCVTERPNEFHKGTEDPKIELSSVPFYTKPSKQEALTVYVSSRKRCIESHVLLSLLNDKYAFLFFHASCKLIH